MARVVRVAPGHVKVTSSTRIYGVLFGGAGVALSAGAAAALLHDQKPVLVVILVVAALICLAMAVLPAWDRIALEIRPGEIGFERRARGVRQRGTLPREALLRLRCKRVVYQGDKGSSVRYPVSLVFDAALVPDGIPGELAVRQFAREMRARAEAESLARELDLPLEDAVGGEPVLRAPDALDARVAREDDPGMPPPGLGVRVGAGRAGLEIAAGTPTGRMLFVALSLFSLVTSIAGFVFLMGFSRSADGPSLPFPVLALCIGAEMAFLSVLLSSAWLQRYRISVEMDCLSLERRVGPLRISRATLPVRQIEALRIEAAGPLGSTFSILSDARIARIPQLRPDAARWLQRWVASRVGA